MNALDLAALALASLAFLLSAVAIATSVRRANRWRQSDEEKQAWIKLGEAMEGLTDRVISAERWHDTEIARSIKERIARLENAAGVTDVKMLGLATQADIAGLTAQVRAVAQEIDHAGKNVERAEKAVDRAERAIERIESHLMEHKS